MSCSCDDRFYNKFNVSRNDGQDDHPDSVYFTLDFGRDPWARAALITYIDLAEEKLPELARQLRKAIAESALDDYKNRLN